MLKQLFFVGAITLGATAGAQTVPNAGFENWTNATGLYEEADSWASYNFYALFGAPAGTVKTTDAHSGTYAAQLTTLEADANGDGTNDTIPGVLFLGNVDLMAGSMVEGGAFNDTPDSLAGWYKYAPSGGDQFAMQVLLTRWNSVSGAQEQVATGVFTSTPTSTYTRFSIGLDYQSAETPDTAHIVMLAGGLPNSSLWVDDLEFITNSSAGIPVSLTTASLQLYPNPANESVSVIAPKSTKIEVINSLGMHIETVTVQAGTTTIRTSGYKNGIYFLKTEDGNLERFVIQH